MLPSRKIGKAGGEILPGCSRGVHGFYILALQRGMSCHYNMKQAMFIFAQLCHDQQYHCTVVCLWFNYSESLPTWAKCVSALAFFLVRFFWRASLPLHGNSSQART